MLDLLRSRCGSAELVCTVQKEKAAPRDCRRLCEMKISSSENGHQKLLLESELLAKANKTKSLIKKAFLIKLLQWLEG